MPSLTEHFARRDHHAALPFRADCPLCRAERLQGPPPRDELVPLPVQAGVLAALMAASSVALPASALAKGGGGGQHAAAGQGGGHGGGGGQGGGQGGGGKSRGGGEPVPSKPSASPRPAADSGGDDDGGRSMSSAPESIRQPDPEPRHSEPSAPAPRRSSASEEPSRSSSSKDDDDSGRSHRHSGGHSSDDDGGSAQQAPAAPAARTHASPAGLFVSSEAEGRRTTRAAYPALERIEPHLSAVQRKVVQVERELTQELGRAPSERRLAERTGLSEREVASARQEIRERVRERSRPRTERVADRGPDRYTVRSGDSLWSITEEQLAEEATDAQVAAGVKKVWKDNTGAIASGDPDEIMPGERLEL